MQDLGYVFPRRPPLGSSLNRGNPPPIRRKPWEEDVPPSLFSTSSLTVIVMVLANRAGSPPALY